MKKIGLMGLALVLPLAAQADVLFDNGYLGPGNGGYFADGLTQSASSFYMQSIAVAFSLSDNSTVDAVTFWGASENFFGPTDLSNFSSFEYNVYDTSFNLLGSGVVATGDLSATLVGVSIAGSDEYELRADISPLSLAAGDYFFNIGANYVAPQDDAFAWSFSSTVSTLGGSFGDGIWTTFPDSQTSALRVEGSVDAVPEPASMAVFGLGLAAFARRRRAKAAK